MKNCEEITGLYEKGKLTRISLGDRMSIRMHKSICKNCKNYMLDSDKLDRIITHKFKHLGNYQFSDNEKDKLKERLKDC